MNEYQLYCFAQSGNAYKAALMLALSNAPWQPLFVNYFDGETRTAEFRKMNPMGEVPVLLHNGKMLSQSGVILNYLQKKLGKFGPENEQEELEILRWLLFDNHKLTGYCATLRFLRTFTEDAEESIVNFFEGRALGALNVLNDRLRESRFVAAERLTIADISLCGYLYFPDEIGIDFSTYPQILRWLDEISTMESWQHPYDLMPGHPLPEQEPNSE